MEQGRFITLEGGEGAGKSTLARALAARLEAVGLAVELTREPGGSPKAERIRELILSGRIRRYGAFVEALMFSAARIDHIDRRIRPALREGRWVVCDRFLDSTRVYQGQAGQIPAEKLAVLEKATIDGLLPDLTLILDLPAELGLARAEARRVPGERQDRFEGETLAFHRRLRDGFLAIAAAEPARCVVIDASVNRDELADAAWRALSGRLLSLRMMT